MPIKYFPQLPEDPISSDTETEDNPKDLLEPIPSAHSREEQDEEEQHTSEGDSSGTSGKALEHGSKAAHDINVQKTPPPEEEPAESASGKPSSSKAALMAPPPQGTPSTSTLARPKLNDLGLPIGSS